MSDFLFVNQIFHKFDDFEAVLNTIIQTTGLELKLLSTRDIKSRLPADASKHVNPDLKFYEWDKKCKVNNCPVRIRLSSKDWSYLQVTKVNLNHEGHELTLANNGNSREKEILVAEIISKIIYQIFKLQSKFIL